MVIFIVWIVFSLLEKKKNLSLRIVLPSEKDNILEFNQYMKSDKMPELTYADITFLIKKNRLMCKQSRKFFNNKNRWAYSLWLFNVNNMSIWSDRKQTYFISFRRLYEKVCMKKFFLMSFRKKCEKCNWF